MCGGLETGDATRDGVKGVVRLVLPNGRIVWLTQSRFDELKNLSPEELLNHIASKDDTVKKLWSSQKR